MPISTSLYTELRFAISDYMQRGDMTRMFDYFRTKDDEASRTVAVIMSSYTPKQVWHFLDFVANLQPELRKGRTGSIVTCCYIMGKMGQTDVTKSIAYLKQFLSDEPLARDSVDATLSNLWVLNPRKTSLELFGSWISSDEQNEDLAQLAVSSCSYLASRDPRSVADFLRQVSNLEGRKVALAARALLKRYIPVAKAKKPTRPKKNSKRKKRKEKSRKKHKKKRRGKR